MFFLWALFSAELLPDLSFLCSQPSLFLTCSSYWPLFSAAIIPDLFYLMCSSELDWVLHDDAELFSQDAVVFFHARKRSLIALSFETGGRDKTHVAECETAVFSRTRTERAFGEM